MELLKALLAGKRVDRVPLFPMHAGGFSARNVGYPLASIYTDPEKSFWAQVWTQQQYGWERVPMYNYACYGAWEFGGEIKLPSGQFDQAPSVVRYPVNSAEDIEKLEKDWLPDVKTRGSIPINMEFSRLQARHGLPVVFICGTPFTRAANVCGVNKMMRWLIREPDLAKRLIRLTVNHLLEVARYWVDTFGGERIIAYAGNPTESDQMLSPKQFAEFCLPYTVELHEKVLALGVRCFKFHACGDQNLKLSYLAQIPLGNPGIISVGHEVDLDKAIAHLGNNIIVGNVEPAVVQTGTPQQVYELARKCIEKGKKAPGGYMLATGCEIPPNAPPYNVYMLKKAANDFGGF